MKLHHLLPTALFAACSGPTWDGDVATYGTLHEVLGQGQTQGRVVLAEASTSPGTVGIGALEGLSGEVVVFEGEVYTGRVESEEVVSTRGDSRDQAAFLAVADVPAWEELHLARTLGWEQLEPFLKEFSDQNQLSESDAFPFVIEGQLLSLKSHVINGSCPIAHPDGPAPARQAAQKATGRLVGFYSKLPPGTLTHHGSRLHVHVVLAGGEPLVAHVDEVTVTAGSRLLVPKP